MVTLSMRSAKKGETKACCWIHQDSRRGLHVRAFLQRRRPPVKGGPGASISARPGGGKDETPGKGPEFTYETGYPGGAREGT